MGGSSMHFWMSTPDTVRVGWADDAPYVAIGGDAGVVGLTVFLGHAPQSPSLTDRAELAMRLIEALQDIRRELLQRASDPHAAGDGAKVPHRSIRTHGDLLTHLVADHAADPSDEALTEATDVALEARHRNGHGQPYGVDGYITQPDDDDERVQAY